MDISIFFNGLIKGELCYFVPEIFEREGGKKRKENEPVTSIEITKSLQLLLF